MNEQPAAGKAKAGRQFVEDEMEAKREVKVRLGRVVVTTGALAVLVHDAAPQALRRHAAGDWGNVSPEDKRHNDENLITGGRLLSEYQDARGITFWILTEQDRSTTTILLPDEY